MSPSAAIPNSPIAKIDHTQHKLLLLFVFDKMEMPLTDNTVYDFCTASNSWLTYIECKLAMDELIEANFLVSTENAAKEKLYSLSPEGRICLAHFFPKLPSSIREDVTHQVKTQRMNFKRKQEYFADYDKCSGGSFKVRLRIVEPEQEVVEVILTLPTRELALSVCEKWSEKAPTVYQSIYDLLIDN